MKMMKLKALAVAVVGLAAGNVMAACPTAITKANGGAWDSSVVTTDANNQPNSTLQITDGGLNGTACKLSAAVLANNLSNSRALVIDSSPTAESRYRARFYFDISKLTAMTVSNQQAKMFNAVADSAPAGIGTEMLSVKLKGGASKTLIISISDASQPGPSFATLINNISLPPSANGVYRLEIDLQKGNGVTPANNFRYWLTDASTAASDNAPTGTATVNNSGWSGVDTMNLGLFGLSPNYRATVATVAGQVLDLDELDSRRSTFINL